MDQRIKRLVDELTDSGAIDDAEAAFLLNSFGTLEKVTNALKDLHAATRLKGLKVQNTDDFHLMNVHAQAGKVLHDVTALKA